MKRDILINANPRETRVAIMEDEQLVWILSAWDIVRGVADGKVGGRSAEKAA